MKTGYPIFNLGGIPMKMDFLQSPVACEVFVLMLDSYSLSNVPKGSDT